MARIAIIYYSMHDHITSLARAEKDGIEAAGGSVDVYRIQETLTPEILNKMHAAPPDLSIPVATPQTMIEYDAFLFGIPTRFGNYPAQWKTYIDNLGRLWQQNALSGKYFGVFVASATQGGGQETTAITAISTWVHQGMIYVPLGYKPATSQLNSLIEVRGGSPWGAGTFSSGDGSRKPTMLELEVAEMQGRSFYEHISRVSFS